MSTEQRILRSTVAGYAIQLARLLVGFVAKLALARLVLPEGHGLYEEARKLHVDYEPTGDLRELCHRARERYLEAEEAGGDDAERAPA